MIESTFSLEQEAPFCRCRWGVMVDVEMGVIDALFAKCDHARENGAVSASLIRARARSLSQDARAREEEIRTSEETNARPRHHGLAKSSRDRREPLQSRRPRVRLEKRVACKVHAVGRDGWRRHLESPCDVAAESRARRAECFLEMASFGRTRTSCVPFPLRSRHPTRPLGHFLEVFPRAGGTVTEDTMICKEEIPYAHFQRTLKHTSHVMAWTHARGVVCVCVSLSLSLSLSQALNRRRERTLWGGSEFLSLSGRFGGWCEIAQDQHEMRSPL